MLQEFLFHYIPGDNSGNHYYDYDNTGYKPRIIFGKKSIANKKLNDRKMKYVYKI
jgi:hypothetical protein